MTEHVGEDVEFFPHRGDAVEAWLKNRRDACLLHSLAWTALDDALDGYRLAADTSTPLSDSPGLGMVGGHPFTPHPGRGDQP